MLVLYDPFGNRELRDLLEEARSSQCRYYGSDLARTLGYDDAAAFRVVVEDAMRECTALQILARHHFRVIFRQGSAGVYSDFKLSRLACVLIVLVADSRRPAVSAAKLSLLKQL
jgi:hypothetical protein